VICSSDSRDRDDSQYSEYLDQMPWWAYSRARAGSERLAALCNVESIPSLALIDPSGDIITTKAADLLRSDPTGVNFPYYLKPIERLSQMATATMSTMRCCIAVVATGGETAAEAVLMQAALEEFEKPLKVRDTFFFIGDSGDEFVQRVMKVRPSDKPATVVLYQWILHELFAVALVCTGLLNPAGLTDS
jgi:hypothetical protein